MAAIRTFRLVVVGALVLAVGAGTAPVAPAAVADGTSTHAVAVDGPRTTVDTRDRASVALAYTRWLQPTLQVLPEWTGSVERCSVGTEGARSRAASISAVNYYRAMAGLPGVTENKAWSDKALQAALMMQAGGALSHSPDTGWACASPGGIEAAGKSNLVLTWTPRPVGEHIAIYMLDPGPNNHRVGHRRWILRPSSRQMGTGTTSGANALWVVPEEWNRPVSELHWVPWPPNGHVPWEIAMAVDDRQLFRWSLTAHGDPAPDFSGASVAATLRVDGRDEPLHVAIDWRGDTALSDNTLVWHLARRDGLPLPYGRDAEVQMTVDGVRRSGLPLPPQRWTVRLFRAEMIDIARSSHRPAIEQVTAHQIAGGYSDGSFRPDLAVTRGQMASFLVRAFDLPPAGDQGFVDAKGTHAAAMNALAARGIAGGFSDRTYRPDLPVTRGQMATFLSRALELEQDVQAGSRFPDAAASSHAGAIDAVASRGIAGGFPDGTYRPEAVVQRGQMATFISRALRLDG